MGNRKTGKQNSGGVAAPQKVHGRITNSNSRPADIQGGRAPFKGAAAGYPGVGGVRFRGAQQSPDAHTSPGSPANLPESRFSAGGDPMQGKIVKGTPHDSVKGGAAPVANMTPPGGGKSGADLEQNRMDAGRRGFAKGGKVEKLTREERVESPRERAREERDTKGEAKEAGHYARGGKVKVDQAYAKGGKVNRYGVDHINGGVDKNPKGTSAPANGGNGGLPGGNAAIPLAQPGGTPSTGVTASGRMEPSYAGADTGPLTPDSGGVKPKLRSSMVKRSGGVPSLPRPHRA